MMANIEEYNFLVDSHCHLKYLKEEKLFSDCVVEEAFDNGIKILNNICTEINEMDEILKISEKYYGVYCSVGQHPENVKKMIPSLETLLKISENKFVIGIGETGLDYHYYSDEETKKSQRKSFEIHIEACRKTNLPLIVHSRDCDKDMIDILQNEKKNGDFKFLLHCFSSSEELAMKSLDLNGYISFSGILTFKNSQSLQEIAKKIPLDRILLETDAPFLAPVPVRGEINKPSNVKFIAKFLSNLLNKDFDYIQNITTRNFFELFNKAKNKTLFI